MIKNVKDYAKVLADLDCDYSIREWNNNIIIEIKDFITNKIKKLILTEEGYL